MADIAFFLGALIPTYLLSRLFHFFLKNTKNLLNKAIFANVASLILSVILAGYGAADGGEPKFMMALDQYFFPQVAIFIFDYYRIKSKKK